LEAVEAKKNLIFQATRKVLARRDFHALKMDDIAQAAGIAKGTLYLYFKNKESLYTGLIFSLFNVLMERVAKLIRQDQDPEALLRKILRTKLAFFEEHRDVFMLFFREGPGPGANDPRLRASFKEHIGRIARVIERGIQQGSFRKADPTLSAFLMIGLIRSAVFKRILGLAHGPLTRDADELWALYKGGIGK
jgi:AcrR family transcriptional regulator